jgi:rhodanese-related sulfurtransferase/rubrerythrin
MLPSWREEDYLLVDVRQPEEFEAGHLAGAMLLPLSQMEGRLEEIWRHRDKRVVFYCETGNRSRLAATLAASGLDLPRVFNLVGGIRAWHGQPVVGLPKLVVFDRFGTAAELLRRAMDQEKGAYRLYQALQPHFAGTEAGAVINELLDAELTHARAVHQALAAAAREPIEEFDTMFERLPGQVVETGQSPSELVAKARSLGRCGSVALLEMAVELECRAHDLYRNLAELPGSAAARDAALELAQEEKLHAATLLQRLGDLAPRRGDPGVVAPG